MSISADSTPQGKFLSCRRMLDVQGALITFQLLSARTTWTLRQLRLGDTGDLLEVVVTQVTEVGRAKAEEDGDGTAVATLVLKEVCTMLRTHL